MGTGRALAESRISRADNGVMLEIIQSFEGSAARLSPVVLIGPGGAAVVVGLFVWLGGLGFKRILLPIAGAVCGGILGIFVIRRGLVAASVSAAVAAVVAAIFERVSVALLAGALVASICFVVLIGPTFENSQTINSASQDEESAQTGEVRGRETLEQLKACAVDVGKAVKRAASQMPMYKWAIIATSAVVPMAGTFISRRLISALCFSIFGTTLVFVGMVLLLLYKEAAPISRIAGQPLTYAGVFAAMTAFGTVEQVLLCRAAKTQAGKKTAQENRGTGKRRRSWRTT